MKVRRGAQVPEWLRAIDRALPHQRASWATCRTASLHGVRDGGWAKQAIAGPEPPRELYLDRKKGQRDPIRLCTQNGGWVWNVHCVPPLRVAKRSTPHDALRNWLNKHENAIQPASVEAARQLAKEWEALPMPQPTRRTRSLPPRVAKSHAI